MTSSSSPVLIPLLNPNELDVRLVSLEITEGQPVRAGDLLCTVETTKSTAEILAEAEGYVVGLDAAPGQMLRAGDVLCYISESLARDTEIDRTTGLTPALSQGIDVRQEGLRITQPAMKLAQEMGLDLSTLPHGPLVTERTIRELHTPQVESAIQPVNGDDTAIIVYGGGGHGKSVIDLLRTLGTYRILGVLDDRLPPAETILGLPVLGGADALNGLINQGITLAANSVGGIGDLRSRLVVFQRLAEAGFTCPVIAHPSAVIEPSARVLEGVQVFPQAYIGSDAQIGFGVIVNTGAIVSHDCQIGDYTNLSPGVLLAGGVVVGEHVLIGMGVTVNLGVEIGAGSRVGNGATIKADVPANGIVRAGSIWPD